MFKNCICLLDNAINMPVFHVADNKGYFLFFVALGYSCVKISDSCRFKWLGVKFDIIVYMLFCELSRYLYLKLKILIMALIHIIRF